MVALNRHEKTFPTEFHGFLEKVVCDQECENCMFGVCSDCPEVNHADISWWQWTQNENGKIEKQEFTGSFMECFALLMKRCPYFLKHRFSKRMQSCAFKKERESIGNDVNKVIIQVEFAENYNFGTECNPVILLDIKEVYSLHCMCLCTLLLLHLNICYMISMLY